MDLRYKSPAMRRKSPQADPPMDESETMDEGQPVAGNSKPTAFLPKELGGGKVWKPGDEIVLTVDAVDPETGELQVSYAQDGGDESEPTDSMSAMDQQLPQGEGE